MGHDDDITLPACARARAGRDRRRGRPDVRGSPIGDRSPCRSSARAGVCRRARGRAAGVRAAGAARVHGLAGRSPSASALRGRRPQPGPRCPTRCRTATAAGLGCRFATAYRAVAVHGPRSRPGEWVAVHGCGGVGLSAVMVAGAAGARVVAVDVSRGRPGAAARLGAATVAPRRATSADSPPELTGGGAHVSLDALGCRRPVSRRSVPAPHGPSRPGGPAARRRCAPAAAHGPA